MFETRILEKKKFFSQLPDDYEALYFILCMYFFSLSHTWLPNFFLKQFKDYYKWRGLV